MKEVPPGRPCPMTLRTRSRAEVFQSPSAREPVAVGHQPLRADAGQLLEGAEILEVRRERLEVVVAKEGSQPGLDPCRVAQRLVALASGAQFGHDGVGALIVGDQFVDRAVRGGVHRRRPGR